MTSPQGGPDLYLPIPIGVERAGVLIIQGMRSSGRMAQGCAILVGLALERERLLRLELEAEETQASDRMKSTLLAALAHDLKTPVAAARAAIENWAERGRALGGLASRRGRDPPADAPDRRVDGRGAPGLGVARPRREIVTAAAIVEAALARSADALSANSLAVDVPAEDLRVQVDPSQITEALGHGLENAARYSPSGSEIAVSAAVSERPVRPARRRPRTGDSGVGSGEGVRAVRAAAVGARWSPARDSGSRSRGASSR